MWRVAWRPKVMRAALILAATLFWVLLLVPARRAGVQPWIVVLGIASAVVILWSVLLNAFASDRLDLMLLQVVLAASALISFFSYCYWEDGSIGHFNHVLTRLDALYFTVGTLSTAGTGNIVAISDVSRRVQTAQMLLGMGLVLAAVTAVLGRLVSAADRFSEISHYGPPKPTPARPEHP